MKQYSTLLEAVMVLEYCAKIIEDSFPENEAVVQMQLKQALGHVMKVLLMQAWVECYDVQRRFAQK